MLEVADLYLKCRIGYKLLVPKSVTLNDLERTAFKTFIASKCGSIAHSVTMFAYRVEFSTVVAISLIVT